MKSIIGIRREDKNQWEKRVPIIPNHIREYLEKNNIKTIIQPSSIRVFTNQDYTNAGAEIDENLSNCPVIFAVKEIPLSFFEKGKTYVFFSHTIKGQKYNMPMLKKMMELKCNLIDYERIVNNKGFRLVFFGRFAGLAGMVDTLWTFGQKLRLKGINTPFNQIRQTINYENHLDEIKQHFKKIGEEIKKVGFPEKISPVIIGFAGYGNVSKGAQEILNELPLKEISPIEIKKVFESPSNKVIYKVVFKEEDIVQPNSNNSKFDLKEYYNYPERYHSIFEEYFPYLSILMNCIYWDYKYPRLITKEYFKKQSFSNMRLEVVGDISVDVNGAIEFTEKTTNSGNPVFTYDPKNDTFVDGINTNGICVMAVDNLPCELPKESSTEFSNALFSFVPAIAKANYNVSFKDLDLPAEIKNAVILYHGKLAPNYQYIDKYL